MEKGTLLLVDGTAVAYRAFFAIRELSTRSGRPTNAVYGFIRMLEQLRRNWAPTHWCVAFDGGLPAERLAALAVYKAQRKPMPDALKAQLPVIDAYLDAARVPYVWRESVEADDIIATLVRAYRDAACRVLVATHDKDLYQLVGPKVSIVPPTKTGATMGAAEVQTKTGVPPGRIGEWLALVGDSADNMAGVPGIGPKTAARLLDEFGTLEGLLERLDDVPSERIRNSLHAHRERIALNMEVVRLRFDLDGMPSLEDLAVQPPDRGALLRLFKELEFNTLAAEIQEPVLL